MEEGDSGEPSAGKAGVTADEVLFEKDAKKREQLADYENLVGRVFSGVIDDVDEVGYHMTVQVGDAEMQGYIVNHLPPRSSSRGISSEKEVDSVQMSTETGEKLRAGQKRTRIESRRELNTEEKIRRIQNLVEPIDRLKVRKRSVIVVGAGLAGLAAAWALRGRGYSVTVLEARDRLGGRAATDWSLGCPIDMGAAYIHGSFGNPLHEIARDSNLRLYAHENDDGLLISDGKRVPEATKRGVGELWELVMQRVREYGKAGLENRTKSRRTLESMINKAKAEVAPSLSLEERQVFKWHISNLEILCAANVEELSAWYWDYDDAFAFLGHHLLVRDGFSALAHTIASGMSIRYGTPVKRIERDVEIHTLGTPSKPVVFSPGRIVSGDHSRTTGANRKGLYDFSECTTKDYGVRIRSKSGETFLAESCIVTLPLGVLQRDEVSFLPRLPSWKEKAIHSIGFGTLNKVALRFKVPFWLSCTDENKRKDISSDDPDYVARVSEKHGEFCIFLSLYRCLGSPVLVALISGRFAEKMEGFSDGQVVERVMGSLRSMYRNAPSRPAGYVISRWKSDKFARGSYSYPKVDTKPEDFDLLARKVGHTLYFAGEATSKRYFATAHGAYMSGIREAAEVLKSGGFPMEQLSMFISDLDMVADPHRDRRENIQDGADQNHSNPDRHRTARLDMERLRRRMHEHGRGSTFRFSGASHRSSNLSLAEMYDMSVRRQNVLERSDRNDAILHKREALEGLNELFKETPFPSQDVLENTANKLGLQLDQVILWFIMRRNEQKIIA